MEERPDRNPRHHREASVMDGPQDSNPDAQEASGMVRPQDSNPDAQEEATASDLFGVDRPQDSDPYAQETSTARTQKTDFSIMEERQDKNPDPASKIPYKIRSPANQEAENVDENSKKHVLGDQLVDSLLQMDAKTAFKRFAIEDAPCGSSSSSEGRSLPEIDVFYDAPYVPAEKLAALPLNPHATPYNPRPIVDTLIKMDVDTQAALEWVAPRRGAQSSEVEASSESPLPDTNTATVVNPVPTPSISNPNVPAAPVALSPRPRGTGVYHPIRQDPSDGDQST